MNTTLRRSASIAALLALFTFGWFVTPSGPSTAYAGPPTVPGHARYQATGPAADASTDNIWCEGEDSPVPQYSASNRTVHYGFKTICNYTDDNLWIHSWLYSIVGSGEKEHSVYQDDRICSAPGVSLWCGDTLPCIVRTTGRWYGVVDATSDFLGNLGTPAQGPTQTLGCSDIL